MNNKPQNTTAESKGGRDNSPETFVNNSDFVPQSSASIPQVIKEVDNNHQLTAAENSEATESASQKSTSSVVQQQHVQQRSTESENIVLPTNSELLPEQVDNIIDEHREQQPPEIQPIKVVYMQYTSTGIK